MVDAVTNKSLGTGRKGIAMIWLKQKALAILRIIVEYFTLLIVIALILHYGTKVYESVQDLPKEKYPLAAAALTALATLSAVTLGLFYQHWNRANAIRIELYKEHLRAFKKVIADSIRLLWTVIVLLPDREQKSQAALAEAVDKMRAAFFPSILSVSEEALLFPTRVQQAIADYWNAVNAYIDALAHKDSEAAGPRTVEKEFKEVGAKLEQLVDECSRILGTNQLTEDLVRVIQSRRVTG